MLDSMIDISSFELPIHSLHSTTIQISPALALYESGPFDRTSATQGSPLCDKLQTPKSVAPRLKNKPRRVTLSRSFSKRSTRPSNRITVYI